MIFLSLVDIMKPFWRKIRTERSRDKGEADKCGNRFVNRQPAEIYRYNDWLIFDLFCYFYFSAHDFFFQIEKVYRSQFEFINIDHILTMTWIHSQHNEGNYISTRKCMSILKLCIRHISVRVAETVFSHFFACIM